MTTYAPSQLAAAATLSRQLPAVVCHLWRSHLAQMGIPAQHWLLTWVPKGPTFTLVNPLTEGPINPRLAYGPNMAIRAEIFHSGYRFDEAIGPKGANYAMGSEGEV